MFCISLSIILTDMVSDRDKAAIVCRAPCQYKTTFMGRSYGRGIDFVCFDTALIDKGGVHLIQTIYPETLSEEIQCKGRTNRQDNPGSFQGIYFEGDLVEDGWLPCYGVNVINWDAFLANQRQREIRHNICKNNRKPGNE